MDSVRECAIGRRVVFETQHEVLVQGATSTAIQLIRYNPDSFFNGVDFMKVFVSDQGFYSRTGVINNVNDILTIKVVSYNNIPSFVQPFDGQDSSVMNYQKGLICNQSFCENLPASSFPTGNYPPCRVMAASFVATVVKC